MKKNLLDKAAAIEIIARAEKLQVDKKESWGKMTVTEMLLHCNLANTQILEEQMAFQSPTLKQQLLKISGLYLLPTFPRNRKGAKRNDTKGHIDSSRFDEQLKIFISIIEKFSVHTGPMTLVHPAFGSLTRRQWGRAAWMHMDHHLRQFGV